MIVLMKLLFEMSACYSGNLPINPKILHDNMTDAPQLAAIVSFTLA